MNRLIRKTNFPNFPRLVHIIVVAVFTAMAFSSCVSSKNSYYFQTLKRDTTMKLTAQRGEELKIQKNDLLSINISSLNKEEDAVYNSAAGASGLGLSGGNSTNGYVVNAEGNIQYHRLGIMQVAGMTRAELKNKIQKDLTPFLKDPVVTVNYLNHKITLLGEISKTQVISMPEEQISLLEVLGASGDVTQNARRDNILVIRDMGNGKEFKRVNLEDHSIFTSKWYWLQPGDVVYVEPNDKRIKEEKKAKLQQTVSIALSALSVAVIILDRVTRKN